MCFSTDIAQNPLFTEFEARFGKFASRLRGRTRFRQVWNSQETFCNVCIYLQAIISWGPQGPRSALRASRVSPSGRRPALRAGLNRTLFATPHMAIHTKAELDPIPTRTRPQTRPQNQPRPRFSNPPLPTSDSTSSTPSPTPNPTPNPTTRTRLRTRSDIDLGPDNGIDHRADLGSWLVLFKCLLGSLKRIILWALSSDPHRKTIHTRR